MNIHKIIHNFMLGHTFICLQCMQAMPLRLRIGSPEELMSGGDEKQELISN
jgi:hypothetical protein